MGYDRTLTSISNYVLAVNFKLSSSGGGLIIASDGIWDALSSETTAQSCRGLPAELAAKLVVKEALRARGLKDDTTCVVVDIIPYGYPAIPQTPKKKQNLFTSLIHGKRFHTSLNKGPSKLSSVGTVEELFEGGSAMLAGRLGKDLPLNSGLFKCAVCQGDEAAIDDISGQYSQHHQDPCHVQSVGKRKMQWKGKGRVS